MYEYNAKLIVASSNATRRSGKRRNKIKSVYTSSEYEMNRNDSDLEEEFNVESTVKYLSFSLRNSKPGSIISKGTMK